MILQQSASFGPFVRQFVPLVSIARWARNNNIARSVGAAGSGYRHDMLNLAIIIQLALTVITASFLTLILGNGIGGSKRAFEGKQSGPATMFLDDAVVSRTIDISLSPGFPRLSMPNTIDLYPSALSFPNLVFIGFSILFIVGQSLRIAAPSLISFVFLSHVRGSILTLINQLLLSVSLVIGASALFYPLGVIRTIFSLVFSIVSRKVITMLRSPFAPKIVSAISALRLQAILTAFMFGECVKRQFTVTGTAGFCSHTDVSPTTDYIAFWQEVETAL